LISYFLVGLRNDAKSFFTFLLIIFLVIQVGLALLGSLFSNPYISVMWWSVFNDHQRTMVLQTVARHEYLLIARATHSDAHKFMPSNVLEEPQVGFSGHFFQIRMSRDALVRLS
jgi:hypothetical protein